MFYYDENGNKRKLDLNQIRENYSGDSDDEETNNNGTNKRKDSTLIFALKVFLALFLLGLFVAVLTGVISLPFALFKKKEKYKSNSPPQYTPPQDTVSAGFGVCPCSSPSTPDTTGFRFY